MKADLMAMRFLFVALILLVGVPPATSDAQSRADWLAGISAEMEPAIQRAMKEGGIPSISIALVKGDEVVWVDAFGYSNLWAGTEAVPSTVYLIGSTFKAMSTMGLLQLAEAGHFELDDPVNQFMGDGLAIRGELPDDPVTFRHMLTHTSGMPGAFGPFTVWGPTAPPPLNEYLASDLQVNRPPLEEIEYSNMAYSLVAHVIEEIAEVPYKQFIQDRIWQPLGMMSTAFEPTPEMEERLAIPYVLHEQTGRPVATTRLKASVWPAGIVYGTVHDQANWLIANLNGGVFKGRHLLGAEWVNQMHTRQYEAHKGPISGIWGGEEAGYGLTWWTEVRDSGHTFAHSGSVPGYTAFLQGNLDAGVGVAMLTNGNRAHPHLIKLADHAIRVLMASE